METPGTKWLIVNADDFGLSAETNRGIIHAHEHGIVTSASLMVRQPAAPEAAELARRHPRLGVGLHVDLWEWIQRDGEWRCRYEVVPSEDTAAITGEIRRQLDEFHRLTGRAPTHLDSHQHAHNHEPVRPILTALAKSLRLPLRASNPRINFSGDFYGQGKDGVFAEGITPDNLRRMIRELRPGVTEFGCHPGFDGALDSDYCRERRREVEALCDASVREELVREEVILASFSELPDTAWNC